MALARELDDRFVKLPPLGLVTIGVSVTAFRVTATWSRRVEPRPAIRRSESRGPASN